MEPVRKRLLFAMATALVMCLVLWLNLSEASPVYRRLLEEPAVGYGLLILNLPALFVSRVLSGTPPSPAIVYVACFAQWFALGYALSVAAGSRSRLHREQATRG